MFWMEAETVILTDPHFGKGASFRAAGVPVPTGTTERDLMVLSGVLTVHSPRRLLILGDFFHDRASQSGETLAALRAWRSAFPDLGVELVRGNHDKRAGDPPADLGIRVHADVLVEGPFVFSHAPREWSGDEYVVAGHIHPAVRIRVGRHQTLAAACFLFSERQALMPAFGGLTGKYFVQPSATDRVFLVGPDEVVEWRGAVARE